MSTMISRDVCLPPSLLEKVAKLHPAHPSELTEHHVERFAQRLWEGNIGFLPDCHARPLSIHSTEKGGNLLLCQCIFNKDPGTYKKQIALVYALLPEPKNAVIYFRSRIFSTPGNLVNHCPGSVGGIRIFFTRENKPVAISEMQSNVKHAQLSRLDAVEREKYVRKAQGQAYFGWQNIVADFAFGQFNEHKCPEVLIHSFWDFDRPEIKDRQMRYFEPAAKKHGYVIEPKLENRFVRPEIS